MLSLIVFLVGCYSGVTAQSTVTIFAPGFDEQALQGQVAGEPQGDTTTYVVSASPGAEDSGLGGGTLYYVDGGSTVDLWLEAESLTVADGCELHTDDGYAVCSSLMGDQTPATISDLNFLPVDIVGTTDAAGVPSGLGGDAPASTASASVNTGAGDLPSGVATIFSESGANDQANPSASRQDINSSAATASASSDSEDSSALSVIASSLPSALLVLSTFVLMARP